MATMWTSVIGCTFRQQNEALTSHQVSAALIFWASESRVGVQAGVQHVQGCSAKSPLAVPCSGCPCSRPGVAKLRLVQPNLAHCVSFIRIGTLTCLRFTYGCVCITRAERRQPTWPVKPEIFTILLQQQVCGPLP